MNTINTILIPMDFSPAAEKAMQYALHLVENDESICLTLLHVTKTKLTEEQKASIESRFEERMAGFALLPNIKIALVFKVGELIASIVLAQKEYAADLILIGTRGAKTMDDSDETATSELVITADCPVLVVPEFTNLFSIKTIVLALDNNQIDDSFALGVLHDIARKFDASIHVLTISNENSKSMTNHVNDATLEYYLETLNFQHVAHKSVDIEKGIISYIKENEIDLLVILPRNHAKKSKPSTGSLTRLLSLHTDVPLLAID